MSNGQNYKTESKEQIRRLDKAGEVQIYWRIYATTRKETYFFIEVREDELDKAPELLEAKAKKLDSI